MTDPAAFFDGIIKILFVCVIITAAYIITTKNLITLVRVYALQSLTLVAIALALYWYEGTTILLAIALITLVFKVIVIPYFIATIQEKIRIKRDIEFHFLSPTSSLLISLALMLVVYITLSRILPGHCSGSTGALLLWCSDRDLPCPYGDDGDLLPEKGDHKSARVSLDGERGPALRPFCRPNSRLLSNF